MLVRFNFVNNINNLYSSTGVRFSIMIYRNFRRTSYPDMQQQIPIGAICGSELNARFKIDGLDAPDIPYKLLNNNYIIQQGSTDKNGMIIGLNVDMPDPHNDIKYTLEMDVPQVE